MAEREPLHVIVWHSPQPRVVRQWELALAQGATVRDALEAAGLLASGHLAARTGWALGIWGRKAGIEQPLRDGDRIEIYRPLKIDPKVARRERFNQQGVRRAGLFARKKSAPANGD